MRTRLCVALSVAAVLIASPLWAWRMLGDNDELKAGYQTFAKLAMTEAQKCLDAKAINKARFYLLAISDLCVPGGGNDPKVPEDVIAEYKVVCSKVWPEGAVSDEAKKEFDVAVKAYETRLEEAYINAFYVADSPETYTVANIAKEFVDAEAKRPAGLALAEEFCAKALPPIAYQEYCYGGKESWGAVQIQVVLANLFAGPETIRQVCKETFVPDALAEAEQAFGRADGEQDPLVLKSRAEEMEELLNFVFWADPENPQAKELQAKAKGLRDKAKAIYAAEVKSNRVPADAYQGGDAADLKAAMKKVFQADPGDTILRVTITSAEWTERAHVWSGTNAIDVGWYRLIDGAVVVKKAEGTCWVHPVTFGRRWTGVGDNYGELLVYSWADAYEVLPENVNK